MQFAKKSDLKKMKTVSQFGHFGNIFCHFEGSLDKGGKPKVFPPNMKKAPRGADPGAVCNPLARSGDV